MVFRIERGAAMYMVVFVTLLVALIGGYTQIYMKQAAVGFSQQSGVASAMIAWHLTATALAEKFVMPASISAAGCTMTSLATAPLVQLPPGTISNCAGSGGTTYVSAAKPAAIAAALCITGSATPCYTELPKGYSPTPYTFYSVAFQAGTPVRNYVMTYLQLPADTYNVGTLCLPGNLGAGSCTQVSSTYKTLYKELEKNPLLSSKNFGIVNAAGFLTTPSVGAALTIVYPILNNTAVIPVNALGIISQITPCPSCP